MNRLAAPIWRISSAGACAGFMGDWRKSFEQEMSVFDFHGWADVDLHADQAGDGACCGIFIDDDAHDLAVDQVSEDIASDDEMDLIPVIAVEKLRQRVFFSRLGDDRGFGVGCDPCHLAAEREEGAAAFFVVLSGPGEVAVNVALIAFQGEGWLRHLTAAVVDPAVASSADTVFDFEFEVGRQSAAPDRKRVGLEKRFGSDLADEASVFDAPVFRIGFPMGEGFTVEDRHKSGRVCSGGFG